MTEIILSNSKKLKLRLNNCLKRHYELRDKHDIIKEGYEEMFFTNKYLTVKSVQDLVKAENNYGNEFSNLLRAGSTIGMIESTLSLIPMMIKAQELIGEKPIDKDTLSKHIEKLNSCEIDIKELEAHYDEHEARFNRELEIYNIVTQTR